MTVAREAPLVPADDGAIASPAEMENGDAVSGVASLSGDLQSALAEVTGKSIDELKLMQFDKEGMNYVCDYMDTSTSTTDESGESAQGITDNLACKVGCGAAAAGAAMACATVIACMPGVAGTVGACAGCPDVVCYLPPINTIAGAVCMSGACSSLPASVQGACNSVCAFCDYSSGF